MSCADCADILLVADSKLEAALQERDEARKYAQACEWALESELEYTARLKADLALECREVAERQREACARTILYEYPSVGPDAAAAIRAAPLVTEGDK